jgi:hypothetical protein
MPVTSQAAGMLRALASPVRLTLLSLIVQRRAAGEDCSTEALAEATGLPMRALLKDVTRLQDCGLLTRDLVADLPALRQTADALVGELPITRLLVTAPDLARYFVNGRLTGLTVDHTVKLRLAPLLAQLLPDDRPLPESEVNERLGQVHDDYAYLRRMLVDFGQLTRDGATNYRRCG